MIRREFLRRLAFALAGLAAGEAVADPVDDITEEIRSQGFRIVRVERTWLGRIRIIGQNGSFRREVVIDPTTGEIRRDLLSPRSRPPSEGSGDPAAEPDLGSSRSIGTSEESAGGRQGSAAQHRESGEASADSWGGGWGSRGGQPAPADGGNGNANAQDSGTAAGNGGGSGNGEGNGGGNGNAGGNGKGGGNGNAGGNDKGGGKGSGQGNDKGGGKGGGKGNDKGSGQGNGGRTDK